MSECNVGISMNNTHSSIANAPSEALLLSIARSDGLKAVTSLRRENDDGPHTSMEPFAGDYASLFRALHGIRLMAEYLASKPIILG